MTYALSLRATPAQQRALDAITGLTRKLGYPPTLREMCDALGLRSTNAVACLLTRLRTKGLVTWSDAKESRTLRVVTEPGEAFPIRRCSGCERDVMVVDGLCYLCEARLDARHRVQHDAQSAAVPTPAPARAFPISPMAEREHPSERQ